MISALTDFGKRVPKFIVDNSPAILTAIGVTGALTTAYLTGRASLKVGALMAVDIMDRETHNEPKPTNKELVVTYWRHYIPAVAAGSLTVAAIIVSNRVGARRAAALASAFAITERAFDEYKSKVVEKLGSQKEEAIRAEIAQDRVTRTPPGEIIVTGGGSVWCMDAISGRYFMSSVEEIRKAENLINYRVTHDMYASLSDLYEHLGLPATSISDEVGWNVDKLLEIKITGALTEDERRPVLYIDYTVAGIRGYNRLV